jgi:AcrR family transcriptional regulator
MNEHSFIYQKDLPTHMNAKQNTEKYHRILEAACRVFARMGFHQATIAMIA